MAFSNFQAHQLQKYSQFCWLWNQKINLTGSKSETEFFEKQVLDCVAASELLPHKNIWVDVGSGAGLPGLVWAILHSEQKIVLVESLQKRVLFLQEAKNELQIENVVIYHSRLENLPKSTTEEFLSQNAAAVSRGTTNPRDLLKLISKNRWWKYWIVFSTAKTHQEFESLALKYKFSIEKIPYARNSGEGILTKIISPS